jgi:hypothetical protein
VKLSVAFVPSSIAVTLALNGQRSEAVPSRTPVRFVPRSIARSAAPSANGPATLTVPRRYPAKAGLAVSEVMLVPPLLRTRTEARPLKPGAIVIVASMPCPGGSEPRDGATVTAGLSESAWKWSIGAVPSLPILRLADCWPAARSMLGAETASWPPNAAAPATPHWPRLPHFCPAGQSASAWQSASQTPAWQ